jgi:uncharacterized iron-regulated protein
MRSWTVWVVWVALGAVGVLATVAAGAQAAEQKPAGKQAALKKVRQQADASKREEAKDGEHWWGMPYPLKDAPVSDDIFHVPTGTKVSREAALDVISAARVVYVGETHDNVHAHRVELAVIQDLQRRFPGRVAIGMEMFREPQQEALDRWVRGEYAEDEFIKAARWYDNWGDDYGYYRDILAFAREHKIDVVALNPDKKLQDEVSRAGLDNLPPDLKAKLPEIGELDRYQRESLKAIYGAHMKTEGMVDSFLRVQALWEETMATRVVSYLADPWNVGKRMVVLAGGWHVRHGFGIPKKVFRRMPAPYVIVSPEELSIPEEKKDQMMDVDLPAIPFLGADFFWMVPYETLEKDKVRMGTLLESADGRMKIKRVLEGTPAEKAGVEAGSELLAIDGQPVADMADVFYLLRNKRAGDAGTVTLRKDGVEKTLALVFFKTKTPPQGRHGAKPEKKPAAKPGKK